MAVSGEHDRGDVFEYIVGVVMEKIFKVKYWDYSKQRFQFQGYICLRSSLCWGFLGLILTSVIHPPIEKLVLGLPFIGLIVIDVLFSAAFISDVIVSVRSALDLAKCSRNSTVCASREPSCDSSCPRLRLSV